LLFKWCDIFRFWIGQNDIVVDGKFVPHNFMGIYWVDTGYNSDRIPLPSIVRAQSGALTVANLSISAIPLPPDCVEKVGLAVVLVV
jgi:hypothetical protein